MDKAWAGLDAGKEFHWAHVLDASGRELLSRKVENDEADIARRAAYSATTTSRRGTRSFAGGSPVAFLDFDLAPPARPAWDVAHLAWQFVPLADDAGCARHRSPLPRPKPVEQILRTTVH